MTSPAFTDIATCKAWLAKQPTDPLKAYGPLVAETRRVLASSLDPLSKFHIYETLRAPLYKALDERARQYRGQPVPFAETLRATFQEITGMWQALGDAYRGFIADMAGSAPDLAEHAALISQRALRCYSLAMAEHHRAYHACAANLWLYAHEIYSFAEAAGALDTEVEDAHGRTAATTTAGATYARMALEQLAQPDSLSIEQMDAVSRWIDRWERLPRLVTERPAPDAEGQVLALDLSRDDGPSFSAPAESSSMRYFDMEALSRSVRQATAALKQQTPAQAGLGNMPRDACERLLIVLHIQWCAAGTGRVDERKAASIKVQISPTLASIHFHLTGQPFKAPGAEFSSADRQRREFMGEAVGHGAGGAPAQDVKRDTWEVVNQSRSGFLGMSRKASEATPVSHGQLVGLHTPAKVMYLGIVQRLSIDREGAIWVGLRLLPGTPQAVAARTAGTKTAAAGKYDRALLLPEDAARKITASIVLMPGWFEPARIIDVHPERRLKLTALLDKGANFERASTAGA